MVGRCRRRFRIASLRCSVAEKGRPRRSPIPVLALKGADTQLGVAAPADHGVGPSQAFEGTESHRGCSRLAAPPPEAGEARRSSPNSKGFKSLLPPAALRAPALREGWRMPRNPGSTGDRSRRAIKCSDQRNNEIRDGVLKRNSTVSASAAFFVAKVADASAIVSLSPRRRCVG